MSEIIGVVLDDGISLSFTELTLLCGADAESLRRLVGEGLLHPDPAGARPEDWRFRATEVRLARRALRLAHDLHLEVAGAVLAAELLDEIDSLRARVRILEYQLHEGSE